MTTKRELPILKKNLPQLFAVLLLLLFIVQELIATNHTQFSEGDSFHSFQGHSIQQNKTIHLNDFSQDILLINFFATWCEPCKAEIPDLITLEKKIGSQQFSILGLAGQSGNQFDVTSFVNQYQINYPVILIEDEVLSLFGVQSFPTTFLVGPLPERKVLWQTFGPVSLDNIEFVLKEKGFSEILSKDRIMD